MLAKKDESRKAKKPKTEMMTKKWKLCDFWEDNGSDAFRVRYNSRKEGLEGLRLVEWNLNLMKMVLRHLFMVFRRKLMAIYVDITFLLIWYLLLNFGSNFNFNRFFEFLSIFFLLNLLQDIINSNLKWPLEEKYIFNKFFILINKQKMKFKKFMAND